jgi:hypothetical protein
MKPELTPRSSQTMAQWPHGVASADTAFGGNSKAYEAEHQHDELPSPDPQEIARLRDEMGPDEEALLAELENL